MQSVEYSSQVDNQEPTYSPCVFFFSMRLGRTDGRTSPGTQQISSLPSSPFPPIISWQVSKAFYSSFFSSVVGRKRAVSAAASPSSFFPSSFFHFTECIASLMKAERTKLPSSYFLTHAHMTTHVTMAHLQTCTILPPPPMIKEETGESLLSFIIIDHCRSLAR